MEPLHEGDPKPSRLISFVLEGFKLLGIALACVVILAIIFALLIKTGAMAHPIGRGWFGFVPWTGILFWVICKQFKGERRRIRFWIAFICLLLIHTLGFVLLLRKYPELGLGWFVPITMLEVFCMVLIFGWVLGGKSSRRANGRGFGREQSNS
jgi:hypothetical protein